MITTLGIDDGDQHPNCSALHFSILTYYSSHFFPCELLTGRFDMRIPEFVVEKLKLSSVLEPLLTHLRSIMAVGKKVPELRTHNIVFVPVGSKEQVARISYSRDRILD
jgi:hypothetical protein